MARTDTLGNFLTDVADAIRTKKGSSDTILASDFDTEIENLPSGGGADLSEYFVTEITENKISESYPIAFVKKYPDIVISDTVTQLGNILSNGDGYSTYYTEVCPRLVGGKNVEKYEQLYGTYSSRTYGDNIKYIDVSGLDITKCWSFRYMFKNRGQLLEIQGTEYLEGSKGYFFQEMFYGCVRLTQLNLSKLGNSTQSVRYDNMFYNCRALTFLDIRSLTFNNVSSHTNMFGSSASNGPADNCEIVVKDNDAKTWINTNYSRLTNVKTVAEYEAE